MRNTVGKEGQRYVTQLEKKGSLRTASDRLDMWREWISTVGLDRVLLAWREVWSIPNGWMDGVKISLGRRGTTVEGKLGSYIR